MLKVFNLLYLSDERSEDLLRVLDMREVEYQVINEKNQDTGWIYVEDEQEYTYARDIIDEYLEQPINNKPVEKITKISRGAIVFTVMAALLFLSRYIKELTSYF